jgi:hypothetical protein
MTLFDSKGSLLWTLGTSITLATVVIREMTRVANAPPPPSAWTQFLGELAQANTDDSSSSSVAMPIAVNFSSNAAQRFPDCYEHFSNDDSSSSTGFHALLQQDLSSQPWADFDWSISQATCGCNKCFYPSRSNQSEGYLIAANIVKVYDNMQRSMEVEERLRHSMPARVMSLSPPELIPMPSPPMMCLLADRTYQPSRLPDLQEHIFFPPNLTMPYSLGEPAQRGQLVIQKVLRVPEPYFLLGWSENKILHVQQHLPHFIQQHAPNQTAFVEQLTVELVHNIPKAFDVVPDLVMDMQGLVDVHGNFYHIDVDRVFKKWSSGMKEWAHEQVQEGTQTMLELLQQTPLSTSTEGGDGSMQSRVER